MKDEFSFSIQPEPPIPKSNILYRQKRCPALDAVHAIPPARRQPGRAMPLRLIDPRPESGRRTADRLTPDSGNRHRNHMGTGPNGRAEGAKSARAAARGRRRTASALTLRLTCHDTSSPPPSSPPHAPANLHTRYIGPGRVGRARRLPPGRSAGPKARATCSSLSSSRHRQHRGCAVIGRAPRRVRQRRALAGESQPAPPAPQPPWRALCSASAWP